MNGEKVSWKPDGFALLLLLAMVLWFGHGMLWDGKVPFFRDLGTFFYPMRFSLAQALKAGEVPLWDHRMGMGFPLLANFQSGSFYPPHFIFVFVPFFAAIRLLFLFHYFVAATGAYALCRRWHYPSYLALVGAMLFTLGGAIVSLTNLLNHFQAAVWLPWVVFFWERSLERRSLRSFLALAAALLLQFLAGSPEIYIMTLGLVLLDGLRFKDSNVNHRKVCHSRASGNPGLSSARVVERNWIPGQARNDKEDSTYVVLYKAEGSPISYGTVFLHLIAVNVLIAGVAMVQLLPTLELFLESRARSAFPYTVTTGWSVSPWSLLNFFFLDKEVSLDIATGLQPFFSRDIPLIISVYLGAICLPAVILWLWQSSLKKNAVLVVLIGVSVILALGRHTPIYPFLYQTVPFFSFFRFPEKFLFITNALILFVALSGLHGFFHLESSSRAPFFILVSIWLLYFLPYLFFRIHAAGLAELIAATNQIPLSSPSLPQKTIAALGSLERQLILVSGIVGLLSLGKSGKIRSALFQPLLVGFVFLDLYSAHEPYQFLFDPKVGLEAPRVMAAPDGSRLFYVPRLFHLHPDYFSSIKQSPDARVGAFFSNLLPNTGIFNGFEYAQEIDPLERWPYEAFIKVADRLPPERLYRLLGSMNVGHLVSIQPLTGKGITLLQEFPEYPSWLYRVDRLMPRAFVASEAVIEKDLAKSIELLSSEEFDPSREVILEEPEPIRASRNFETRSEIVKYTNRAVTVLAKLNNAGILILADSYYPGWKVYVDGKEKPILRADFFFRGVLLPAGDHVVEYRYEPRSFRIGLGISLVSLFGIVLYCVFGSSLRLWKTTLRRMSG